MKKAIVATLFLVVIFIGYLFLGNPSSECITIEKLEVSFEESGTCLVAFDESVYDVTFVSNWITGMHHGEHLCGQEYSAEEISGGPHGVEMMGKFRIAKLCK
ncbi:MAG: hypothetical protein QGI60_03660 [archaeon]|jgi:predicted heme/steroid binding protein|nr:hypothetical protein [archaeon]